MYHKRDTESIESRRPAVKRGRIVAPAATPRPVVARLAAEAEKALGQAEVRDRLAALGMDPADSSPEAFAQLIGAELARWTKVVREAGIKAD